MARLAIYHGLKKWELLAVVAKRLTEWNPKEPGFFVELAYATEALRVDQQSTWHSVACGRICIQTTQRFLRLRWFESSPAHHLAVAVLCAPLKAWFSSLSKRLSLGPCPCLFVLLLPPLRFSLRSPFSSIAQIDRITGKNFATRSEVLARHGMVCTSVPAGHSGRTRHPEARRQRGGCRDRGQRDARFDGAGLERNRRRSLRDRLQREGKQTLRAQRQRTFAARLELRANESRARQTESQDDSAARHVADQRAGLRRCLGRVAQEIRQTETQPTISRRRFEYAEEGFPVTRVDRVSTGHFGRELYKDLPGAFLETYTLDGKGRTPAKGDIFKNPELAKTLRLIGEKGPRRILQRRDRGQDRRVHAGERRISAQSRFREAYLDLGRSGLDELSRLRCLRVAAERPGHRGAADVEHSRRLRSAAMGRNSPETLHAMIEAKKIAWADRAKYYADPEFAKIPLAGLLSKEYAAERRKLIDPKRAAKTVEAGNPALEQGDTIYMCTADDEGNMVSLIQSNYRGMGSGIVVPGLGFMFQDRGELFSMEPGHANVYAPGKRPFHTIIPGFVMKDGKPWLAFGVMGGGMQPQGHVQVLTNLIDFGMNVQEAGDAARWQHEGDSEPTGEKMTNGGYVKLESGIPCETVRELSKRGHEVRFDVGGYGGYQAIKVEMHDGQRVYVGASEIRKDGQAAGY